MGGPSFDRSSARNPRQRHRNVRITVRAITKLPLAVVAPAFDGGISLQCTRMADAGCELHRRRQWWRRWRNASNGQNECGRRRLNTDLVCAQQTARRTSGAYGTFSPDSTSRPNRSLEPSVAFQPGESGVALWSGQSGEPGVALGSGASGVALWPGGPLWSGGSGGSCRTGVALESADGTNEVTIDV